MSYLKIIILALALTTVFPFAEFDVWVEDVKTTKYIKVGGAVHSGGNYVSLPHNSGLYVAD